MKISREELAEYQTLEAEKKELDQRSRTLGKRLKQIESAVQEQLESAGKDSCKRYGFTLAIVSGRASVKWKDEFVRECGAERAAEIQSAATPHPQKVSITPPK